MIPVIVLAAGRGKRLGSLASLYRKPLLPLGDDSLLAYHFRTLRRFGLGSFVVVVEDLSSPVAREAERVRRVLGVELRLVVQAEARGIGHALLIAEPAIGPRPFVLLLADTFWDPIDLAAAIRDVSEGLCNAVLSVRRVHDPGLIRKECTVELDTEWGVRRIVEKPSEPLSPWKPCGLYFFGPRIFDALRRTPISPLRNELEITDAIQTLADIHGGVRARETLRKDVNVTFARDLVEANVAWLTARGLRSLVAPTASASGASLDQCVVGPGATVGHAAVLRRVVVLPDARVPAGDVLVDCVVAPGLGVVS